MENDLFRDCGLTHVLESLVSTCLEAGEDTKVPGKDPGVPGLLPLFQFNLLRQSCSSFHVTIGRQTLSFPNGWEDVRPLTPVLSHQSGSVISDNTYELCVPSKEGEFSLENLLPLDASFEIPFF